MTTAQYTSPYDVQSSDAFKKKWEAAQRNCLQRHGGHGPDKYIGKSNGRKRVRHLHNQSCMSYCISKREWVDTGSEEFLVKYQELKVNAEHLHIETDSPMPTNKKLMFEAACGSYKGHVYGFGSKSTAITAEQRRDSSSSSYVLSVSSTAAHNACIEREKRMGIHTTNTRQVRRLHDLVRFSVRCAARICTLCSLLSLRRITQMFLNH
ncbi:hypothetical protein M9H77_12295 [Catharanthus roseus]|uniref:Uncharacterized protein n=1 Tax=Catharanthus roseus TaxID=4058 RepID=A0ACC0BH10_CATRO|nr:hypothetical protein M9H77_12295 [Catharanthus roseus]